MIDPSNLFILITILVTAILSARLLSPHIARVFTLAPSRLDKILNPVEREIYRLVGVDPARGMNWKEYFLAALIVNIFQMAIAFVIFSFQGVLPLNPQGFPGLS
ncbi:potassium-transporting ATPase subunit KdpA [Candidatus Bathyarchaeota archaeon]|nr:MAG: potassium-transporting ATPase subunit KdpA [Candidatus Bathyarchaeota archaeon]